MDKIQKSLNKLSTNEKRLIQSLLAKLYKGELDGLNIQKLKSQNNIFRLGKSDLRIIYQTQGKEIKILAIERRSEKTYQGL